MTASYDFLYKILIVGDSGVGKSALLMRYTEDSFSDNHIATIGVDFRAKNLQISSKMVKLQIWDTAGQERFRTITESYYRGAHGVIVAFDVTRRISFDNVSNWIKEIKNSVPHVKIILAGNKSDSSSREVDYATADELAKSYGFPYIETSAKDNINVVDLFNNIANAIFDSTSNGNNGNANNSNSNNSKINVNAPSSSNQRKKLKCVIL